LKNDARSELPASSHIEAQTSLVKLEVRDGFSRRRQIEECSVEHGVNADSSKNVEIVLDRKE